MSPVAEKRGSRWLPFLLVKITILLVFFTTPYPVNIHR